MSDCFNLSMFETFNFVCQIQWQFQILVEFLNPSSCGGGPKKPSAQEILCHFLMVSTSLFSFGDFSSWSLYHPLMKSVFGFIFENFEKSSREDTWSASFLSRKSEKSKLIDFFCNKPCFFIMNLTSTSFQLSFEVYYISVAQKLKN